MKAYAVGTDKNGLTESLIMDIHNSLVSRRNKKIFYLDRFRPQNSGGARHLYISDFVQTCIWNGLFYHLDVYLSVYYFADFLYVKSQFFRAGICERSIFIECGHIKITNYIKMPGEEITSTCLKYLNGNWNLYIYGNLNCQEFDLVGF